jgi:hypothetical protein
MTAALVLLLPVGIHAASWQAAVALPMTVEHDTNPRLDADADAEGVTRTILAPDYNLVGTFGRDELQLGIGINLERSSNQSISLNREDPTLRLGWQRERERGGFGLAAKYDESSTLFSSLEETGVVASDGTRKQHALSGNWSESVSQRSTLASDVQYSSINYDNQELTSYDDFSASFSWTYAASERIEPFSRFALSRYIPDAAAEASASTSYSPTAGVRLILSEQLEGTLRAGVNQISGGQSSASWQGGFELLYTGERFAASLDAGRSTVASGEGGFAEVNQLRGTWRYAVDETTSAGVDALWQDNKGQTPNTMRQLAAWASRELSPFWLTRLSIAYKQRQQDGRPDASGNILGLTLTYSHPDF